MDVGEAEVGGTGVGNGDEPSTTLGSREGECEEAGGTDFGSPSPLLGPLFL